MKIISKSVQLQLLDLWDQLELMIYEDIGHQNNSVWGYEKDSEIYNFLFKIKDKIKEVKN